MNQISEWILAIMAKFGYLGIIFAMFAENVFPPIPSELIMPAAGFAASRGDLNLILVILAGTFGAMLGALPLYYLGSIFDKERLMTLTEKYGKYVFVKPEDISATNDWFDNHGKKAVFFGRMVPGIRSFISIPAGMNKMPLLSFLALTALGSSIWTTVLTLAGYYFGENYQVVETTLAPYSKIFGALALIIIVGWFIKRRLSD
ncbi:MULTISPECIES: DedA family protein [unclassified Psychrobacter]|uniref:DedA family protein n=1 Tax=unclassified Psychrobacter TaxID=196806 RepID=UPI00078DF545|nr:MULTISPECIES: DedA family protein [unclassified Psychrobacter]AMN49952.1 alkaline phosphatase [Psychrobacter sp. P2G3]AMN67806.1 alkaline phosphatase [Psychrobacter sp. P11G5]